MLNSFIPELQLKDTESAIKSKLIELLSELRGLTFVASLVLLFKKRDSKDKRKYDSFYSSSKAEMIINESDTTKIFMKRFRLDYWFSHWPYH